MVEVHGCEHAGPLTPRFRARDYVTGDAFEVSHCAACGLDVTAPRPAPEQMAAYYPAAYYGEPGSARFPRPVEWGQRVLYDRRARAVEALAGGRSGRVLDVGCGPGALLGAFRRRGWDVQGTELSQTSARRARGAGIPVHVGPLESWPWPGGAFDAVVMWHVLEHWGDPTAVLRRVHALLRPGGVFMAGVPNFGSVEARLSRDKWFHLDVPRHLVHFTPASLERAVAGAGFDVVRRSFFAPEYDLFSFIQSTLNRVGVTHNLLYDLLRGRGTKLARGGRAREAVATVLLAPPLGALGVPLTVLLGLARRGSALTLLAVKRAT
jgi:SAM-dependent methyltransferase